MKKTILTRPILKSVWGLNTARSKINKIKHGANVTVPKNNSFGHESQFMLESGYNLTAHKTKYNTPVYCYRVARAIRGSIGRFYYSLVGVEWNGIL